MNRKDRQKRKAEEREFIKSLPEALALIPANEYPRLPGMIQCWRSRKYLVQVYQESNPTYGLIIRMSVCRANRTIQGKWDDGITWDELQAVKHEIGYGDWYGVEVYSPDAHVINVANFRHIWLMRDPLPIGWR